MSIDQLKDVDYLSKFIELKVGLSLNTKTLKLKHLDPVCLGDLKCKQYPQELAKFLVWMYGSDDNNLIVRSLVYVCTFMRFSDLGEFCTRIKTVGSKKGINMENQNWRETEKINRTLTQYKIDHGIIKVNTDRHWGKSHLIKNFKDEIDI